MKSRSIRYAAACEAGARVRRSGRYLTREALRRDPSIRDLIRCAGWSAVWGGAVQGWADANRELAPSNNPSGQAVEA